MSESSFSAFLAENSPVHGNQRIIRCNASEILMIPLGGCNEIGMNMTLYGYDNRWIIVDSGIAFPNENVFPNLQHFMPDPSFIKNCLKSVVAMVITHAHEDHIGSIPHFFPELKCPIYASPFAFSVIRGKLMEAGVLEDVRLRRFPVGGSLNLGPFLIETASVTHSIPESMMLSITTPIGTVVHSGDWKIDDEPLVGYKTDLEKIESFGKKNVLAFVCDSTNAHKEGRTPSEFVTQKGFEVLFEDAPGKVIVACFSSNIARLKAAALAAQKVGRRVCLVGRSLMKMEKYARFHGYLDGVPRFISDKTASGLSAKEIVVLSTGTQGEVSAGLGKMFYGESRIKLLPNDMVIYSARCIPGNEDRLTEFQDLLRQRGVSVITPKDGPVHVSGHPSRGDLSILYSLLKPKCSIPVHGTPFHLQSHLEHVKSLGISSVVIPKDGHVIRITESEVKTVYKFNADIIAYDGTGYSYLSDILKDDGYTLKDYHERLSLLESV